MHRFFAVTAVVLLATQVALAATALKKVTVNGQLSGGVKVTASCTLSTTGQTNGSGQLTLGTANYPFNITKIATGQGTVILSGNFTVPGGYPFTLTAKVPNGAQTFSYVVNGKTISYAGQGNVTVQ